LQTNIDQKITLPRSWIKFK